MATRLADPEQGELDDVVAMERWPLPPHQEAVRRTTGLRRGLEAAGIATAAGFLRSAAVTELEREFAALVRYANVRTDHRSIYGRDVGGTTEAATAVHPGSEPPTAQPVSKWTAGHITRDMIPPHSVAHRLYVSPMFKRFVADSVGVSQVFEYADPLAGLVVTVLPPGGSYGWHYDTNEFVVTINICSPDGGGRFEYCPDLRRPGNENLDGAQRVVAGQAPDLVRSADGAPGDLQLFRGRYSLHRVSPVEGHRYRLTLVLAYADRPGVIGPLDRTRRVYGRVTEAHLLAGSRSVAADGLVL